MSKSKQERPINFRVNGIFPPWHQGQILPGSYFTSQPTVFPTGRPDFQVRAGVLEETFDDPTVEIGNLSSITPKTGDPEEVTGLKAELAKATSAISAEKAMVELMQTEVDKLTKEKNELTISLQGSEKALADSKEQINSLTKQLIEANSRTGGGKK